MIPIRFGPRVCGRLDEGAAREWLVTDGRGGYAMGTVSGLRTRRYHGLLMVSMNSVTGDPPAARRLALADLDPVLVLPSGAEVPLATHEWADGTVHPRGFELLSDFALVDGVPRWRWRVGDVVIEREIAMTPGRPAVAVVHRLLSGGPVTLALDPLVTWRDGHGERYASGPAPAVEHTADGCVVEGAYRIAATAHGPGSSGAGSSGAGSSGGGSSGGGSAGGGCEWWPGGAWWLGAHYREEAARGLAPCEDLWHAGRFAARLDRPGDVLAVSAWAGGAGTGGAGTGGAGEHDLAEPPPPAVDVVAGARARARALVRAARAARAALAARAAAANTPANLAANTPASTPAELAGSDDAFDTLALAADAFVIRTHAGAPDVIAGYPWFGTWSRDTMTSYEGLFLATGRAAEGRELLSAYARTLSAGMLANTADTGSTEYNTVDATLWFLHAVERHVTRTGDTDLAAALLPALVGVVDAHVAGTRYGIRVDPADGLLTQGAAGHALTWMDARIDGVPVTPRAGKPVEVNALWVNGLAALVELARLTGRDAGRLPALAEAARASFGRRFPAPEVGWLHDVLDGPAEQAAFGQDAFGQDAFGGQDPLLRPNQLLAWSLPYAPLTPDAATLARVGSALLTPLGPRSLAPGSPSYVGVHRGGPAERDRAYHQGTVWPWLTGPYLDAICKLPALPKVTATIRNDFEIDGLLSGIEAHLTEFGLGSVSETADGQPPHLATGCPFQAWSVAEVLRVRGFRSAD